LNKKVIKIFELDKQNKNTFENRDFTKVIYAIMESYFNMRIMRKEREMGRMTFYVYSYKRESVQSN